MALAIEKARQVGSGFVGLRDGRHYGMAAHYPMMALPHDMIGISVCNSRPWVAPTFGAAPMIGTNPIAVAVPAAEERPFVLDMATSVVASGKFLLARRTGKKVPVGWSQDADGQYTDDPFAPVEGGWLLPLGGRPETSSYKGYGLGAFVDVLSGVLTGTGTSVMLNHVEGVGQWFGAWRIDGFVDASEFKATMDGMIRDLRNTPRLDPEKPVLIPGEIEFRNTADRQANGVPLHSALVRDLTILAEECHVEFPSPLIP
jgi:LDH2 family malate/lactate/ureidoglycolate dehydrogenase